MATQFIMENYCHIILDTRYLPTYLYSHDNIIYQHKLIIIFTNLGAKDIMNKGLLVDWMFVTSWFVPSVILALGVIVDSVLLMLVEL